MRKNLLQPLKEEIHRSNQRGSSTNAAGEIRESVSDEDMGQQADIKPSWQHPIGERKVVNSMTNAFEMDVAKLWKSVQSKVKTFANLSEKILEVHPYAQKAYIEIFSFIVSVDDKNQDIANLLTALNELYEPIITSDWTVIFYKYRKALFKDVSLKTEECSLLLKKISSNEQESLNLEPQICKRIKNLTHVFQVFLLYFRQVTAIEAKIAVNLTSIPPYRWIDPNRKCLAGTRVKTLEVIIQWVETTDPNTPQFLFLLGSAGTGKSAIAHSIGVHFTTRHRIGSFLPFDHNQTEPYLSTSVVELIAIDLAHRIPDFRDSLLDVFHDKPHLRYGDLSTEQWEELIVRPLKKINLAEPVLVVIDALDRCDEPERGLLLKLFTEGSSQLPSNFRGLITSRPESSILSVVSHTGTNQMNLDDYQDETQSDILYYIRHQLILDHPGEIRLHDEDLQLVAKRAEGLFPATVCRATLEQLNGMTLNERISWFLNSMSQGYSSLDDLYRGVLERLFDRGDQGVMESFCRTMAQVICTSAGLSIEALEEIGTLATGIPGEVTLIVRRMDSLLSGVQTRTSPIRPHHTSFRDFLMDESRSRQWSVNLEQGHETVARGCLRVMNKRLSFNMCGLETSGVLNRDIPDLDVRISKCVPQSLQYAVCNWKDHLPGTALRTELKQELDTFLQEKLLFWLELLSLLGFLDNAAPCLEAAIAIYQDLTSGSCKELLGDAIDFIRYFSDVIAQSATHVYLFALPFSPKSSLVRSAYLPRFPNIPVVDGVADHWPQTRAVLLGHTNWVPSVEYSPDGRCIASGSYDKTVRIWDVETGATLRILKCDSMVDGVSFSPDGCLIAACAGMTVHVWNFATGDGVCDLAHEDFVYCIAYSKDGHHIVSGDAHGRICFWSMDTSSRIYQLTHGDCSVYSVAFSTSSRYLASGGEDAMVRVWDANDGQPVGAELEGHTGWVRSVLFSRDDRWIISGSHDATIRIWDFATQQALFTISHPGRVVSLSLSPDGTHVVSGSHSGLIFVWDLATQQMVRKPFVGHSSQVNAVSFSPDGRHIVSGSNDRTVRIWSADNPTYAHSGDVSPDPTLSVSFACSPDGHYIISGNQDGSIHVWDADTGRSIHKYLQAHSKEIICVRFSPDGSRFVTASSDCTLRVWDWATLQLLGEPLRGHTGDVFDVDFSPDGRRIVSSSFDETLRIWDLDTLQCLLEPLVGHTNMVRCVAWSPDGTRIASFSDDRSVLVWDAHTGNAVGEPLRGHTARARSISWSSDARFLMTSSDDGTVRFWNAQTREPEGGPLVCHQGKVYCSRYSPDGLRIVSAGEDRTIRLWDTQTRELIGVPLSQPFEPCDALAFSPDGRRIISRSQGGLIIIWDVDAFTDSSRAHPSLKGFKPDPVLAQSLSGNPGTPIHDGWITDSNDNLVMWVPDKYRQSLLWRGMITVLGRKPLTIDFTNACYGKEWAKCYQPLTAI